MLIGQFETKLTAKRRIPIPTRFRKDIGNKLIVAKFYENCLVLVNYKGWNKLIARLSERSEILTASVRDTERFIKGSAFEIETDAQGRVVLPQILVEYASLSKAGVFVGLGDRVEIWSKENWEKKQASLSEYAGYLIEQIGKHT